MLWNIPFFQIVGSWSKAIVWGCRKPEPCLQMETNCLEWFNSISSSSVKTGGVFKKKKKSAVLEESD